MTTKQITQDKHLSATEKSALLHDLTITNMLKTHIDSRKRIYHNWLFNNMFRNLGLRGESGDDNKYYKMIDKISKTEKKALNKLIKDNPFLFQDTDDITDYFYNFIDSVDAIRYDN